jgi:hypothetical protein
MLHHRRPGDWERSSEVAGRHWRARQALEHDHPNRMPEQGEHAQSGAKICSLRVRFGHDRSVTLA